MPEPCSIGETPPALAKKRRSSSNFDCRRAASSSTRRGASLRRLCLQENDALLPLFAFELGRFQFLMRFIHASCNSCISSLLGMPQNTAARHACMNSVSYRLGQLHRNLGLLGGAFLLPHLGNYLPLPLQNFVVLLHRTHERRGDVVFVGFGCPRPLSY